jgi:hypothetical protein
MAAPSMDSLTARQRDVAERLSRGEHPSEIAKALGMGQNGVYQHRRRLTEKGFEFPKPSRLRVGRPPKATTQPEGPKVVTNGNLVHLLGDTKADLGKRIETITDAEKANAEERERIEAEVAEREERLQALKVEGESLSTTKGALAQAKEAIPA